MVKKRRITPFDLRNMNVLSEPQFSPQGDKVAFIRQYITEDDEYLSHLFMQDTSQEVAKQWTFGNGTVLNPRFSPDGNWLVYVAIHEKNQQPQLYLMAVDGGEGKCITNLVGGATQPVWSPDSSKILFATKFEKGRATVKGEAPLRDEKPQPLVVDNIKYKSDADGFFDNKYKQLALYNMVDETVHFLTDDNVHHEPGHWSPDSQLITYTSNKHGEEYLLSDVYVLDISKLERRCLTNGVGLFKHGNFSPDGQYVACIGHEKDYAGATQSKLWLIELASLHRICLTADWDVHIGDVAIGDLSSGHPSLGPLWSEDNTCLYVLSSTAGNTNLFQVSLNKEIKKITTGEHHMYAFHIHERTNQAVAAISSPTNPGELFLINLTACDMAAFTTMNKPLLDSVYLQEPEEIVCKSRDGLAVQGWLLKPYNYKEGESYPGILQIHGGPHAMYANTFFHEFQLLAAEGYTVFYCNPRGSHGYGQAFVNACRGDYGGMDYEDIMAFTDTILAKYPWIDKERLGVTGGSYGGFMTNWITSHTHRFKAAATLRCISNWISFYGVSDIGYFFTEWEIGADFLDDPDKLWKHSPLKYVNDIETPLLIMHGEHDYRCPIDQAEQLFISLKQRGKETRFVRFPEANHELSRSGPPHLRFARLEELINWFNTHLN
ncbi:S9 family peptidase [Salipaludibacillus agaradhaerens]|uniref:S9 family peptidase n=1 Tax=Salipaludibacillus agaradhaerens TaxID=76935 RepID=UPI000998126D|nr:S9 family peptidase [Salipaludibacillus agaradhaerens]